MSNTPTLLELLPPDILINPEDATQRGIEDGDQVIVFNDRARIEIKATVADEIRPGVVRIYQGLWPEQGSPNFLHSDQMTTYGETTAYPCLVEVKKKEQK
jgi:anaerobic selenocysteine-containing dehydrogenase